MAKPIKAQIKLQLPGGGATPAPPVGSSLGQQGVNIMDFCKQFNAATANKKGEIVPVIITVYTDKKFSFVIKTPLTSNLIKSKASVTKGSSRPHVDKVGKISWKDVEDIAKIKFPDLNAVELEQAKRTIAGSARSMGINVVD
jgi:large subunit ribosomal protein L11